MTDLYVSPFGSDTGNGTQEAPFKTILQASESATPGTTVHVAPGNYEGGFETTVSGTASDPIRYVSDTKWGAKIVPAENSTYNTAWNNVGDHVVIDGFEVDGSHIQGGTPWMFGLYTSGTDSVVTNNKVHDIARHDAALHDGNGGSAIGGDGYNGDTDISIVNNEVYNIGPANGTNDLIHGIYLTTNGDIKNNMVYQVDSAGIHLWHDAHDVNIVNNTVFASGSGILVGAGDFVNSQAPNDHTVVANNIIYDNDYGVSEQGLTGTNNTYANNLVFKNGTDWRLQNGMTHSDTIAADPQFMDYQRDGSGDYRLSASSPAIDAGTTDGAPAADIDGTARTQGAGSDIGAYEFSQSVQKPEPAPVEPESDTSAPDAGTSEPAPVLVEPETGSSTPETGTSQPAPAPVEPEAGTSKPEAGASEPETGSSQPAPAPVEPEAGALKPEAGASEPETGSSQPAPVPVEPEAGASEPTQTGGWKSGGTIGEWIREMVGQHVAHDMAGTGHVDGAGLADRVSAALGDTFQDLRSLLNTKGGEGIDDALAWVKSFSLSSHAENMQLRASGGTEVADNALDDAARHDGANGTILGSGEDLPAGGGHGIFTHGDLDKMVDAMADPADGQGEIDLGDRHSGSPDASEPPTTVDGNHAITLQQDDMPHVGVLDGMDLHGTTLS